ncbi:enoyl-CoA hydratase/isomerase family protein [Metallosphaera tengchongensis]|uniref:Enoyl-CoA hydratase/isomerase family protein n=1 Tax=Metallosphaera tengchongensis TaxID=1532350 RepID=A0A6N0NXA9_9CREN|nr:enoyl-CoA hydratase/isomerase family protein [Metallosphaera tengchongensis]QKR00249.1 enoyl-CoA hydratase/isomerase family protein [Metallosphaera tengchongensis]
MPQDQKVLYEENEVSVITFNRPEKLNALDEESWRLLGDFIRKANSSHSKAIVITGKGRAFSSGDDIRAMLQLKGQEDAVGFFDSLLYAVEGMIQTEKPIIAAVNGLAYGGGCEILLFMDVVIAVKSATFSIPEGKLGLIPPMAITAGVRGLGRAVSWLALTGDVVDSLRARELGLVDIVVEEDQLQSEVQRTLEKLSRIDPNSIKVMKKWIRRNSQDVRDAIRELTLLSLSSEAKRRMEKFFSTS